MFLAPKEANKAPDEITGIFPALDGFWLCGDAQLYHFDPNRGLFSEPLDLPAGVINSVLEVASPEGPYLLVAYDGQGLLKYSTSAGVLSWDRTDSSPERRLPHDRVEAVHLDREGNLWVVCFSGLAFKRHGTSKYEILKHLPGSDTSLSSGRLTSIIEDRSGLLWIGGGRGVDLYNPERGKFNHLHNIGLEAPDVARDDVECLFKDSQGRIWVSIYNSGLNLYLPDEERFKHFPLGGFSRDGISGIREAGLDKLWLSSRGAGVAIYDISNNQLTPVLPNDDFPVDKFNVIRKGASGELWLGSSEHGLFRRNPDGSIQCFVNDSNRSDSLTGDSVWAILPERNLLWVGTYSGLNLMDIRTGRCRRFQQKMGDSTSLSNNGVNCVYRDSSERFWVATDAGLNRFISETNQFQRYLTGDGLKNNFIYGILEDSGGFLWLSTNEGLARFDPETDSFRSFFNEDGLQHNEFNSGAYYKAPGDGQLLFGGLKGFNAFYPESLNLKAIVPQMVLQELRLFNQTVAITPGVAEALLPNSMEVTRKVTFNHRQNVFSIGFAAIHFTQPEHHLYAYKLVGFHKEWIYSNAGERRASFTNLNPGTYSFRLKGALKSGQWSDETPELEINVLSAPWQSNLAYALYLFATLSMLVGYIISHRRMRRTLARLVLERTAELAAKNEALDRSIRELASLDDIVSTINREVKLENVLNTLLEQVHVLVGAAERGNFLMYDEQLGAYRIFATLGFRIEQMGRMVFTFEDLVGRYLSTGTKIGEGLHVLRLTRDLPGKHLVRGLKPAEALLIIEIRVEGNLQGVLILDAYSRPDAFHKVDQSSLARFRNHAISAVVKAISFKALEEKNRDILTRQKQLLTQQRMASLGTLTAGVAHELKNPLNFVNGLADVCLEMIAELREGNGGDDMTRVLEDLFRNMQVIHKHGVRANAIVESMMALSHKDLVRSDNVDINSLVTEAVKLVYNGVRAQKMAFEVAVEEDYEASLPGLSLVAQSFSRALIHLLNNALESLVEKWILLEGGFEPHLKVSTRRKAQHLEISVWDNGMGIPVEIQPLVFDYFFTTRPPDQGNVGLGLSVSFDIIKNESHGQILLKSEEGDFACFSILLPLKDRA